METNRIDYFFGPASKSTTTKTSDKSGGFADLLFDVMSKHAESAVAEPNQVKAALSSALQTTTPRQAPDVNRLDLRRPDDSQSRDNMAITSRQDRPADAGRTQTVRKSDGEIIVKLSHAPGESTGGPARVSHTNETGTKAGRGEPIATEANTADSSAPVDNCGDTDLTEDSQELALGAEDGESETGAGADEQSEPQAGPQAGLAIAVCAVAAATELTADACVSVTMVGEDSAPQTVPAAASNPAAPFAEIDAAAALAAAAKIPDVSGIAASNESAAPTLEPGAAIPANQNGEAEEAKSTVTFAATVALAEAGDPDAVSVQGQTAAVAAESERRLEDAGSLFRRNAGGGRKTASVSAGTTTAANGSAQNNGARATLELHSATSQSGAGNSAGSTAALSGVTPAGFDTGVETGLDTGFGTQTGLPGWNLHLAQGAAVRRGDFVANLRQHLQNLPVHDQVALSIQRSLRDGGGSITLQLSPTELGRIHLKLNIDEENNVQASVMVERPATLELLQRDMKALERALQEAGLKAGPGDLSFSLQGGDPEAFARDFASGNGTGSGGSGLATDEGVDDLPASTTASVIATGDGWVDVQV